MLIGLDFYGIIDVGDGFLSVALLHVQVRPVLVVYVIVGVQVDRLVIAFYRLVEFAQFNLGEGSIVVEEVVGWSCLQC